LLEVGVERHQRPLEALLRTLEDALGSLVGEGHAVDERRGTIVLRVARTLEVDLGASTGQQRVVDAVRGARGQQITRQLEQILGIVVVDEDVGVAGR